MRATVVRALSAVAVVGVVLGALAAPAGAATRTGSSVREHRPTAAVSLGDSYSSGEAGRWKGNASVSTPGFNGTDRAFDAADGTTDPARVYGATAGGCDRSDVAPIISAHLPVQRSINLACSGAITKNVLRASAGGVAYKGEAPQDDQLLQVAKDDRVKVITLGIGGNDLGFSGIVSACVLAYLFADQSGVQPCSVTQQPVVAQRLPGVATAVATTVDDVRATMRAAGYRDGSYRLILESYPTPAVPTSRSRFAGDTSGARTLAGCPISDADADWAANTLTPELTSTLGSVAHQERVQFLNLSQAFRGHELCAASAREVTTTPRGSADEWVRFIDLAGQGSQSESLHPNYYGQKAIGRCIDYAVLLKQDIGCRAVPHLGTWAVHPTPA